MKRSTLAIFSVLFTALCLSFTSCQIGSTKTTPVDSVAVVTGTVFVPTDSTVHTDSTLVDPVVK